MCTKTIPCFEKSINEFILVFKIVLSAITTSLSKLIPFFGMESKLIDGSEVCFNLGSKKENIWRVRALCWCNSQERFFHCLGLFLRTAYNRHRLWRFYGDVIKRVYWNSNSNNDRVPSKERNASRSFLYLTKYINPRNPFVIYRNYWTDVLISYSGWKRIKFPS